jgi:hypothetical protein
MALPGKPAIPAQRRRQEMTSQTMGNGDRQDRGDDVVVKLADIAGQIGKLLETRRLEPEKVPFEGFRSPPGRF